MRLLTLAILLVASAGCRQSGFSARNDAKTANEFTASMSVNPATLDPALSQDVPTNDLMSMVYEGLVGWGPDSRLEPRLAERWEVSPDGRTYTFHLRKATFHSGKPVRAQDFKWTWERNCDRLIQSPTPEGYLGDIEGVDEIMASRDIAGVAAAEDALAHQPKDIRGVTAVDDLTLKVTLKAPRASFLGKLTYPVTSVMPEGTQVKQIGSAAEMVGTGPFKVVSYTPESQVVLEGFQGYYGGAPSALKLTLLIVKDPSTRMNMLRNGKLDWAGVPQSDVPAIRRDSTFTLIEADRPATFYLGMNGKVYPPFNDIRVRQAFNHAIDKDRIVRDVLNGLGAAAEGYLPPSVPQAPGKKPTLSFDPALARELLRASGWEGKMPPVELWVSDPNGDRKRVAEMAISMLRENLGIEANLRLVEASVLIQRATRKELGFFMGSWYMDYLDPENLLSVLLSSYGQNRTAYDNPLFTQLCRKADAMPESSARSAVYREAEDLAIQDAPWIPLYHPREATAVRRGISGLESNAFGMLPPVKARR